MSWTDDQLDKLRGKMAEAKRQGAWISAAEARLVGTLIWTIRRLTMSKGWSGVADGPLPTIGDTKAQGIHALHVTCEAFECRNRRRLLFEHLRMPGGKPVPDTVVFVEIAKVCRFRCFRCGGRRVSVMADWPNPLGLKRDDPDAGR